MLYVKRMPPGVANSPFDVDSRADEVDWRWMVSAVRRRIWSVILVTLLFTSAAIGYVALRPSNYTAYTQLHLTNLKLTFSRDDAFFAESQLDPTFLETQIQIMRSGKIASNVVDHLRQSAPRKEEGAGEAPGPLGLATTILGELREKAAAFVPALKPSAPSAEDPADARREALKRLQRAYSVERLGLSNIVEIHFKASDPQEAARGANEIARAYIEDQQAARVEAAQSASIWLRERLKDVGPRTRIVASASPPTEKSDPRGILIIAAACFSGGVFGVALALLRQLLDGKVRSPEQVERATEAECLGIVPKLKRIHVRRRAPQPDLASERHFSDTAPLLSHAIERPFGNLWHTLRNAQVAIDGSLGGQGTRCIGFTSTFPGEGASTLAANFARLVASQGERVLLVDCEPVLHALSSGLTPGEREGLIDFLESGEADLERYLRHDAKSGMSFLPIGGQTRARPQLIWSDGMAYFLQLASQSFDYVVCDLPALVSVGDVRSAAQHLNGFVLVVGWGQVDAEHLRVSVRSAGAFQEKLLGTVLNRMNVPDMRRIHSPAAAFLSHKTIARDARSRARARA